MKFQRKALCCLAALLTLIWGIPRIAFSQSGGAPQSGYVIVTPVFGAGSVDLFERLSFSRNSALFQTAFSGVLTNSATVFVRVNAELLEDVGIAIVNFNDTDALVQLSLRDPQGFSVKLRSIVIPPRAQLSDFLTQLFPEISLSFTGSLGIVSGKSVGISALSFQGSSFTTLPVTDLSSNRPQLPILSPNVGGPGARIVPIFAAGGGWRSEFVFTNNTTAPISVRLDFFDPSGLLLTNQVGTSPIVSVPAFGAAVVSTPPVVP